ncbi:hypothetical protein GCM10025867_49580 (plasmid) [Frondihabitans sucicola]|uniref:Uncharacterized protein n=1 Tax=Frondihabitans sucicola TaxID=1268041 RepID=A0ABM8GW64_9MICO|nr:hypothetical protein [Frondihabitans sucicola]BDZ52717.1 hypothetical protein GCM10025867_49580 [Frondihabitans sucicola]
MSQVVVEGDLRGGLQQALSNAPFGASCMIDGFTDWSNSRYGWRHEVTGATVDATILADLIEAAVRDGSTVLTLVPAGGAEAADESDGA